jgi:hypothetical protein
MDNTEAAVENNQGTVSEAKAGATAAQMVHDAKEQVKKKLHTAMEPNQGEVLKAALHKASEPSLAEQAKLKIHEATEKAASPHVRAPPAPRLQRAHSPAVPTLLRRRRPTWLSLASRTWAPS